MKNGNFKNGTLISIFIMMVILIMKGLSLLRGCLDELPKERKATIAGDMGELKRELREKVIMVMRVFKEDICRWNNL